MPIRRVALLVLVAALAVVPAVAAALPHAGPIVVGKSIAGVRIGMPFEQAAAAWGGTGRCNAGVSCRFDDNARSTTGVASFTGKAHKITSVLITAPYDLSKRAYVPTGPLTRFRTAKGIRIGSTLAALKKAYRVKPLRGGATFTLKTGADTTSFYVLKGKVYAIGISH